MYASLAAGLPQTYDHVFCPYCWKEVPAEAGVCPFCGADLQAFSQLSYEEKLLRALEHPVRTLRLFAIQVLGQIKSRAALPHFARLLQAEEDVYVLAAVLQALDRLHTDESRAMLADVARNHSFLVVRHWAQQLLAKSDRFQDD